jgi:probable selenium-dependent hydroxylase accessory protein YqeC
MMSEPSYEAFLSRLFKPGGIYTFVGAGGKSTGIRRVADHLSRRGLRVRITTTTKLGVQEFASIPHVVVRDASALVASFGLDARVLLVSGGVLAEREKHSGIDPSFIEGLVVPTDAVLLVEGDGARRLPVKAPYAHEPVIPANSTAVLAVMGARAFDEPVDAASCYNPEGILALLGKESAVLDAAALSTLALHPRGARKGVLPGMHFHLIVNQAELERKRATAMALARECGRAQGVSATLLSWQQEAVYDEP